MYNAEGCPVAIEVFPGHDAEPKAVTKKVKEFASDSVSVELCWWLIKVGLQVSDSSKIDGV
jgi:hypothetical protein